MNPLFERCLFNQCFSVCVVSAQTSWATEWPEVYPLTQWGKYKPAQIVLKKCFCRHYMDSLHICGNSLIMKSKVSPLLFSKLFFPPPKAHSFLLHPVLHLFSSSTRTGMSVTITCSKSAWVDLVNFLHMVSLCVYLSLRTDLLLIAFFSSFFQDVPYRSSVKVNRYAQSCPADSHPVYHIPLFLVYLPSGSLALLVEVGTGQNMTPGALEGVGESSSSGMIWGEMKRTLSKYCGGTHLENLEGAQVQIVPLFFV